MQGFPNSSKEKGGLVNLSLPVEGQGIENFAVGDFFYWVVRTEKWFLWSEPFSKVKTAFCEYWTSIEIKLTWRFLFSRRGVDFWLGRNKNLLRGGVGESTEAGIFPDEGRMKLPPPSRPILPVGKSLAC